MKCAACGMEFHIREGFSDQYIPCPGCSELVDLSAPALDDGWFIYSEAEGQLGPFSKQEIDTLARTGKLSASHFLSEGGRAWNPVGDYYPPQPPPT